MKKILVLIVLFVCAGSVAFSQEDDWRYRNHEDQFKAPALRDYDGDGIPNRRDWRDDDHRPGPGHYEDESEYGADPISALILRPLGFCLGWQRNKEIERRTQERHEWEMAKRERESEYKKRLRQLRERKLEEAERQLEAEEKKRQADKAKWEKIRRDAKESGYEYF